MTSGYDVRCSVIVLHNHEVLLVHHTHDGLDDWVLPGGNPLEGESLTACARRELYEESGVSGDVAGIALLVESAPPGSDHRLLDIVFSVNQPALGKESSKEQGLEPQFVSLDQLANLNLHPAVAGHLSRLLDSGAPEHAAYVGNIWR